MTDDALPSLTWDEARERAARIDVERYDISVDLTDLAEGDEFRAVSTVRFGCGEPGAATFVDCAADVVRATLNGADITANAAGARIPLPALAPDNVLVVESVQRQSGIAAGVHRFVDAADGEAYFWTSFEPDDARRAWACFDQPDLKAPHAFTVTAPAHWTVVSNSGDPNVEDVPQGRRWVFADTPALSTYIPVIDAGPFVERHATRDGYDLRLFARRSLTEFLDRDAEEMFDLTAAGLAFYGERFAMPFPQASYDQVFVSDLGGAMENYGCVTYTDQFIFRTAPSPQERQLRAQVMLHEMAHMWFGDIVTMRWWNDLWLNEAFAQFACCWASATATEFTEAWASFLVGFKQLAYPVDRGPTTHPIRQPAPDVATAAAGFDKITYQKGAAVLKQLKAYVGEEAFVSGLRSYFANHAWGNATLEDLIAALSAASGKDLSGWTASWLDQPGVDTLRMEPGDGDTMDLRAFGPDGAAPRPHRLGIGVYRDSGRGTLERVDLLQLQLQGTATEFPISGAGDLLLVNDEDLTYAVFRPDEASRQQLMEHTAGLPSAIGRAVAVTTVWDMLMTGEVSAADVVGCLTGALPGETAESLIEPLLQMCVSAARSWAPADVRDHLLEQTADACLDLARHGVVRRLAATRALAESAVTTAQLTALGDLAGTDVDLGWRTQQRLAELGSCDEDAVQSLRRRDPDPDAETWVVAVRAARPTAEAKEQAWQAIVVERSIPFEAMHRVARAFWQPGQAAVLAPYADRYLETLPKLRDLGMFTAMSTAAMMFPLFGVDATYPDRVAAAVADADVPPAVEARVREHADQLARMLAARG